jgi:Domain of unknown function (DUF3846)
MRALLIPAFGPVEEVEQDGLDDLRRLVEGHIEVLPMCGREDVAAYVNEEGSLAGLPGTARATQLLRFQIAGPALLCGFDAATGEQTAVPDDLAQAVLAASASTRSDPPQDWD